MTPQPEVLAFQAETKDLLDLMIHSLYTKREIFIRELISNASDALDKLRYEALSAPDLMEDDERMEIRLEVDPEARTLVVSDTGIGMTREETTLNLGTIARSGTKELRHKIREKGGDEAAADLIGQFGVGFYSAFMVAESVEVLTRRAGETGATRWLSTADGFFSISDAERGSRGTTVTLHLRPVDTELGIDDYTQTWRLSEIVRRHSDFIPYPIKLLERSDEVERNEIGQPKPGAEPKVIITDRTLNAMKPLWMRPQSEIDNSDYEEFYKHLTHDFEAPLKTIVSKAEGVSEYHVLLFIPSRAPLDLYYHEPNVGLRLYAKQVLITEKSVDLLPHYLRFIRGVVDAGELPLNISRQQLQHDIDLLKISKWLTKKVLDAIVSMQKNDDELYAKFWSSFGRALKEGVSSDFDNKERLLPLMQFNSSHDPEKLTTLDAYIDRMKEGQNEIFFITGESRPVLERSPHLETLAEKGYEILYLTDSVDELVIQYLQEYKGKRLKSVAKGVLDLEEQPSDKNIKEKNKEELKPLLEYLEKILEAEIKRAQVSTRLTKSPACLTVDDHEESPWLEKILQRGKNGGAQRRRVLEINPSHAIIQGLSARLAANANDAQLRAYAQILVGLALLGEGAELNDPLAFTDSTAELLQSQLAG